MTKFKIKDLVAIPTLHKGGEVVGVNADENSYDVRIADFNPYNRKVDVYTKTFKEDELSPLDKKKGVIVI